MEFPLIDRNFIPFSAVSYHPGRDPKPIGHEHYLPPDATPRAVYLWGCIDPPNPQRSTSGSQGVRGLVAEACNGT